MLIDLHAHTSAISKCCKADSKKVIDDAKEIGVDGIILTNHFQKSYFSEIGEKAFVENYIREYYDAKRIADSKGFWVLFGIELTMELYPNVHMLIYGVEPSFLKENERLYELTQEELYKLVKKNGGILIQAHPFRNGTTVLDTNYMDGLEINCHPLYHKTYAEKLEEIAKSEGLCLICGGDYHADTYRPKCGLYVEDDIVDIRKLVEHISGSNEIILCVQEPYAEKTYDIKYKKDDEIDLRKR